MPGFSTWWRSAAAGRGGTVAGKPRRWFYAAGEPALVAEVETYVRHRFLLAGRETTVKDTVSIDGGDLQDFSKLHQHLEIAALDAPYRLVVIHRPEVIGAALWNELAAWARTAPSTVYLLVLGEARWDEKHPADPRRGLFVLNEAGIYVNCRPLDEARQITYVRNKAQQLPVHLAQLLVDQCGGELVRLKSETEKLVACADVNGFISDALFREVIIPSPGDQFVEALSRGDRLAALRRAPYVASVRSVLTRLERRVTELFLIRAAIKVRGDRAFDKKISDYTRLPSFTVRRLRSTARTFDSGTVRTRYNAIIEAYRALGQIGDDPTRILTPLVARW